MKKNELKYCNIIPLIGGMTIANKLATNKDPEFIVSWEPFQKNDSHIVNHLKTVPYHVIDAELKEDQKSVTDNLKQHKGKIDFVSSVCPCAGLSIQIVPLQHMREGAMLYRMIGCTNPLNGF